MGQHTKADLSHTAIPEESPIPTPSNDKRVASPISDEVVEIGRTVVNSPDRSDQPLPAITIQHPSPEMKELEFDKQIQKGIQKPLVNGWREDFFGEKRNGVVTVADGVV